MSLVLESQRAASSVKSRTELYLSQKKRDRGDFSLHRFVSNHGQHLSIYIQTPGVKG